MIDWFGAIKIDVVVVVKNNNGSPGEE